MSVHIHARKTPAGIRYRMWTTERDSYYTDPMSKEELRGCLLEEAMARINREIDQSIEQATETGTSVRGRLPGQPKPTGLEGPWEEERDPGFWLRDDEEDGQEDQAE